MGLLNIIRSMALREKLPLGEIARRTGMSRNTIKKYLNCKHPAWTAVNSEAKCNIASGFDIRLLSHKKAMLPCQDIPTLSVMNDAIEDLR
jgi:transcriptional regulator with XRE-family HTH domain